MASACRFVLELDKYKFNEVTSGLSYLNIGTGEELTIKELANLICDITKFKGRIIFDKTKPDGTKRKLLCTKRISSLGWKPKYSLREGIQDIVRKLNKQ